MMKRTLDFTLAFGIALCMVASTAVGRDQLLPTAVARAIDASWKQDGRALHIAMRSGSGDWTITSVTVEMTVDNERVRRSFAAPPCTPSAKIDCLLPSHVSPYPRKETLRDRELLLLPQATHWLYVELAPEERCKFVEVTEARGRSPTFTEKVQSWLMR